MIRAAAVNNPSELIVDLSTGEAFVDQNGGAQLPVIEHGHVTSDFAEYLVRFPQIANATVWQLFPAVGPSGITNRNGFDVESVGKAFFEILDTNAAPELEPETQIQLEQGNFGLHRTDVYRPSSYPIADPIIPTQEIVTGFDLTKYPEGKVFFYPEDANQVAGTNVGVHAWKPTVFDIEDGLRRFNVMQETGVEVLEASQGFFDNDFMVVNIIDPATGTFTLDDRGRALSLIRAELWPIQLIAPGGVFEYVDEDNDGEPRVNRQQLISSTIIETRGIIQEISGITETVGVDLISFPVPFSKLWPVNVTAVVEVDADPTHRNATIQEVNNESFRAKVIAEGNNTLQPGTVHWVAKGLKPSQSEVVPSLPEADPATVNVFTFQDQFGNPPAFSLTFQNNSNAPRQFEVILDGVPYTEITNLNAGTSLGRTEQNVDGTYKHILLFDTPTAAFANVQITGNVDVAGAGDQSVLRFFAE